MKKLTIIMGIVAGLSMSGTAFAGHSAANYNNNAAYLHMFEGAPNTTSCYQFEPECKPKPKKCHRVEPRCKPKPPKVTKCHVPQLCAKAPVFDRQ